MLLTLTTLALLVAISVVAARASGSHAALPMQWRPDGSVTWRAPKAIALGFTPALAALVFTILLAADAANLVLGMTGVAFVVAHVFYVTAALRTARATRQH